MFLEDELEYVRLKRNDNIMGWLAIVFVAALVFMFAGIMNSASATGSHSAPDHRVEAAPAAPLKAASVAMRADSIDNAVILVAPNAVLSADAQATATPADTASIAHASIAKLADHDIKTGALILSFALIGGSFVMLTFGGPRGGKREDEVMIDAL